MVVVNKGSPPKGGVYLACDKARRGLGCSDKMVRLDKLEPLLLHLCSGLDPQDLLTDEAEKAREQARLNQRRQAIQGELSINQQIDSYLKSIGRADGALKRGLEGKVAERYARQAELEQEVAKNICNLATQPAGRPAPG